MVFSLELVFPFLLVFFRCVSFYSIGPLFAPQRAPIQVVLLLSLATTFALFPTIDPVAWMPDGGFFGLILLLGREVLLGGLLGVVAGITFVAIRFAGSLIGIQMGVAMAGLFDPASGEQMPLVGRFLEVYAILLFLALDGHHILLRALAFSLHRVGPGSFPGGPDLVAVAGALGSAVFLLALQVGAPIVAALFLTDAALGFVARAVPQMNVFLIGIPAKIGVGMVFLIVSSPLLGFFVKAQVGQIEGQLLAILRGI
ncbi:MAG: flagellar biosynthetic protein FliR [Candidatus Eisenbacteria bacterium]